MNPLFSTRLMGDTDFSAYYLYGGHFKLCPKLLTPQITSGKRLNKNSLTSVRHMLKCPPYLAYYFASVGLIYYLCAELIKFPTLHASNIQDGDASGKYWDASA